MRIIKIRKAKKKDLQSIVNLDQVAQRDPQRRELIRESVRADICYVAVVEAEIAGYAVLDYTFFNCGFISMLYIKEGLRRNGVGTALIGHLEKKCQREKLFTSTNQSNVPMQKLLRKLRYKKSGVVHNLDPGDPEWFYFKKVSLN